MKTSVNKQLKVAVVGAGCSGLTTVKSLRDEGFSPVCFEIGDEPGGLWVFNNRNGLSGAYRSLHINTSTREMEYSDFPMRADIGDFPHHRHMKDYFQAYSKEFSLGEAIRFRTKVNRCRPLTSGGYRIETMHLDTKEKHTENFDALIVANGHHWCPALPEPNLTPNFSGLSTHSHSYIDPSTPNDLRNKDVLVVGMGNSAVDIACELSRACAARSVAVSARRGAWVLPKYLMGKPIDQGNLIPRWLPAKFRRKVVTKSFQLLFGKMEDFGLPQPDHLIGEAHPTVSSEFPHLVASGDIKVFGKIVSATGNRIFFEKDEQYRADAIIYCTGYKVSFPFFSQQHISAPDNELPLYHRAFHPEHRNVFFVGLMQTLGAVMPVCEAQAKAIAKHLAGDYNLPSKEKMLATIESQREKMKKRFVASRRHTMQVDPESFHRLLREDLIQGKKRAARGEGIPFPHLRKFP